MREGRTVWVRFPRLGPWYMGEIRHWFCALNISVHIIETVKGGDGSVMKDISVSRSMWELKCRDLLMCGSDKPKEEQ